MNSITKTNYTHYAVHLPNSIIHRFKYEREARHYAKRHNITFYEVIHAPGIRDLIFIA